MGNNFFRCSFGTVRLEKRIHLQANNNTEVIQLFKLNRSVEIREMYGEIIEGSITNLTGLRFYLDDNGPVQNMSADGAVLSGAGVGAFFVKDDDAAEVLKVNLGTSAKVIESIAAKDTFQSLFITAKNGTNTYICLVYTTTETPIDVKINIYLRYRPVNGGFLEVA
jgi:hypothetical protein